MCRRVCFRSNVENCFVAELSVDHEHVAPCSQPQNPLACPKHKKKWMEIPFVEDKKDFEMIQLMSFIYLFLFKTFLSSKLS
jgi:hypothetical protein